MSNYTSRQELMTEYKARAQSMGLNVAVTADGPFNADIVVIGEGPGEREAKLGQPFVGGAGLKLWDALRKIGITRQRTYITNVVKRQISLSAKGDNNLQVSRHEQNMWEELTKWELEQLPNVKYVLCLGNMALRALTGEQGITNWRGSVIDASINGKPVQAVITFNPAYIIREPKWEIMFGFDINKLKQVVEGRWKRYEIEHLINPSFAEAMDFIRKMQSDNLPISLDIESVGTETACVGLANDPHVGMCINYRDATTNRYSLDEELQLRRALDRLYRDTSVRTVMQNGNFDNYWQYYKDNLYIPKPYFDTLLAHHTLYPLLPHSLAFLTSQYTTHPYYKDDKDSWREGGDIDTFWRYNVKDVCVTLACHRRLHAELRDQNLERFFFDHVMRLQPRLSRATVLGIRCDTTLKASIAEQLSEDVARLKAEFIDLARQATGDPSLEVNPNSPKQLADLFFSKLRLIGRGTATDELNRSKMKEHPRTSEVARAMLNKLDKFKEEDKFLSTYAESKVDPDGRFRCEYKQYGTTTAPGRLSSSAVLWGSGMNLQNQPVRSQPMFIADPGCAFGYFDGEQAEARVVGWLANIKKWKEDFERARLHGNYDCHRALASDMWKIPYEEVPVEDEIDGKKTKRYIAKRCRHGLNYRMLAPRLADTTGLSLLEASSAFGLYHKENPEIKQWWNKEIETVKRDRQLISPMGRRIIVLGHLTEELYDALIAFKPQSTIGDKVCQVWYQCEEDPRFPPDVRVAMNIHDALVFHGPREQMKDALYIAKEYAESPIIVNGESLIIPASFKMSVPGEDGIDRWSTLKKVKLE